MTDNQESLSRATGREFWVEVSKKTGMPLKVDKCEFRPTLYSSNHSDWVKCREVDEDAPRAVTLTASSESLSSGSDERLLKYKKALDLALYYVEGDSTYEGVNQKIDAMLRDEPTWKPLNQESATSQSHLRTDSEKPIHLDWLATPEKAKEALEWERAVRKAVEEQNDEKTKRISELEIDLKATASERDNARDERDRLRHAAEQQGKSLEKFMAENERLIELIGADKQSLAEQLAQMQRENERLKAEGQDYWRGCVEWKQKYEQLKAELEGASLVAEERMDWLRNANMIFDKRRDELLAEIDQLKQAPSTIECKVCGGTGDGETEKHDCPACDGNGYIRQAPSSGEFDEDAFAKWRSNERLERGGRGPNREECARWGFEQAKGGK